MSNEQQPQQGNDTKQDQVEAAETNEVLDEQGIAEEMTVDEMRILELEKALLAAESQVVDQKDSVMRAIANADNARKRAEGEIDKARKFALERFAGELLPVADNLERAIQVADPANEAIKPIVDGVELTLKSFNATLEKFGMKVLNPQGETFNPVQHQAMSMQESTELAPNTVMAVMQKGYELNGRLLRPAMVMVSRAPEGGVDTEA